MMAASLLVTAGLLWLICALAYGDRVPRPVRIRAGDTVLVQARMNIRIEATVQRVWFQGTVEYAEVSGVDGERYIRAMDLLTLIREQQS